MDGLEVLRWVTLAVLWFSIGLNVWTMLRSRRTMDNVHDTAMVALDLLDAIERSHDPGRDVHERLGAAFESGLIRTEGPPVEPTERRTAGMAMAAMAIEAARRANLEIVPKADAEG